MIPSAPQDLSLLGAIPRISESCSSAAPGRATSTTAAAKSTRAAGSSACLGMAEEGRAGGADVAVDKGEAEMARLAIGHFLPRPFTRGLNCANIPHIRNFFFRARRALNFFFLPRQVPDRSRALFKFG